MYFDRRLWQLTRGLRGWIALGDPAGARRLGRRDRPLRDPRRAAVARVRRCRLCRHRDSGRRRRGRGAAARDRRSPSHDDLPPHRDPGAGGSARPALRQDRRARARPGSPASAPAASCCRWSTASSSCRRFFGQYVPQVCDRGADPARDLRLYRVLGRAGRGGDAGLRAGDADRAGASSRRSSAAPATARQQALKSFGSEFLDGVQGLPTLKAFGQSTAYGRAARRSARASCATRTMRVLVDRA